MIDIKKLKLTDDQIEVYNEVMLSIKNHNQAAIHLVTGGGKSFILAKVLYTLKERKRSKKLNVLYISTMQSCTNFLTLMSDEYWGDTITITNFTQLQRDEKYIDNFGKKKFNVIVIDEAHRALAPKTYDGILYAESKNKSATIIAMTANDKRYDARRDVFKWLTPKLTLGVDYNNRGLKNAIENDKICSFKYRCCDIARLKKYCNIFSRLQMNSSFYIDTEKILAEAKEIIQEYKEHAFDKIEVQMKQDLYDTGINGKSGDRWFVFFATIAELKESKDAIEKLFKNVYENSRLTYNLYEFHSENSDNEDIKECLTGKATPYTVDIIMTCMKGGESFHPENTRGIIMNRKTGSEIVLTQQLGRTLQIKELCSECKLIYDLVGNNEVLDITQTIFNGSEKPDDRDIISELNMESDANSAIESLQKIYGDTGEYSVIQDEKLTDVLSQFEEYADNIENLLYAKVIGDILDNYKDSHDGVLDKHPYNILCDIDKNSRTTGKYKLADAFTSIQKMFIQGYFGEHYMDDIDNKEDNFFAVYNMLGDTLYMTRNCIGEATWNNDKYGEAKYVKLQELIDIAGQVRDYNYDYKGRISHTKKLNNAIARLRQLNLEGKLSESYQKYCKRNRIDIDGTQANLISIVLNMPEASKYKTIVSDMKSLVRKFNSLEIEMDSTGIKNSDTLDKYFSTLAKYIVFKEKYSSGEYGKQAVQAVYLKYKHIIALRKKLISSDDYINSKKDCKAVLRIQKNKSDIENNKMVISGDYEIAIMMLSKRNESNNLGKFEQYVLDELGIKEFRGKRDGAIKELLDYTEFGTLYKRFTEDESAYAYAKLQNYKSENMPEYCKKLLNTRKFKQSSSSIRRSQLLLKDNSTVKSIVAELTYYDDEQIDILKSTIKSIEFDSRNLIKYAIPDNVYDRNKVYFDKAIANEWGDVDRDTQLAIVNILERDSSCLGDIVKNLLDAKLIPDTQIEFADKILEITEC